MTLPVWSRLSHRKSLDTPSVRRATQTEKQFNGQEPQRLRLQVAEAHAGVRQRDRGPQRARRIRLRMQQTRARGAGDTGDERAGQRPERDTSQAQQDQADLHARPHGLEVLVFLAAAPVKTQVCGAAQGGNGENLRGQGTAQHDGPIGQALVYQAERGVPVQRRHSRNRQRSHGERRGQQRALARQPAHVGEAGDAGGVHHRAGGQKKQRLEQPVIDQMIGRTRDMYTSGIRRIPMAPVKREEDPDGAQHDDDRSGHSRPRSKYRAHTSAPR